MWKREPRMRNINKFEVVDVVTFCITGNGWTKQNRKKLDKQGLDVFFLYFEYEVR